MLPLYRTKRVELLNSSAAVTGAVGILIVILSGAIIRDGFRGSNEVLCQLLHDSAAPAIQGEMSSTLSSADVAPRNLEEKPSLFQSVAPLIFPIDPVTGKIRLPSQVTTLAIDIGARDSDYLRTLESSEDNTVALILFDPLPISFLPLQTRATKYTMKGSDGRSLHQDKKDRVFAIHAAVGETEGTAQFNVATGPSCGSLLKATESGVQAQHCTKTTEQKTVMVFTLKDILDMIPDDGSLKSIHIKIDAEGADLSVLKGAGTAIHRASSVIIECQDLETSDPRVLRTGSCIYKEAADYMCTVQGICQAEFELSGPRNRMGNVFFTPARSVDVPFYYQRKSIQFQEFYKALAKRKVKK